MAEQRPFARVEQRCLELRLPRQWVVGQAVDVLLEPDDPAGPNSMADCIGAHAAAPGLRTGEDAVLCRSEFPDQPVYIS